MAGDHCLSSLSRPSLRHECKPSVISVRASAIFFWINWLAARGRPNCFRSMVYCRPTERQNSAAPNTPQAMPNLKVEVEIQLLIIKARWTYFIHTSASTQISKLK